MLRKGGGKEQWANAARQPWAHDSGQNEYGANKHHRSKHTWQKTINIPEEWTQEFRIYFLQCAVDVIMMRLITFAMITGI
jgi:hypothetical protein